MFQNWKMQKLGQFLSVKLKNYKNFWGAIESVGIEVYILKLEDVKNICQLSYFTYCVNRLCLVEHVRNENEAAKDTAVVNSDAKEGFRKMLEKQLLWLNQRKTTQNNTLNCVGGSA